MNRLIQLVCAVALVLGSAALFAQAPVGNSAAAGDPKNGKELFLKYTCYGCHGFSAQNGPAGNRLNPMKMTQQGFVALVRNPGAPNRMPPYSAKVISDAQLADIYAYLKTLPDAPAAKDIPLLQQIEKEVK
ncbi:MAG: cytochrome c [Bryobacterales bacterium]|nr:cytochrome c [Bryobacterales bacterium]MBV9399226.1 cytochrome c [Bryobacterales bacterium]